MFIDDDFYTTDDRGLNGFEREALLFLDSFLEQLMERARVYRLTGQQVMSLHQARQVLLEFGRVEYDGQLRIESVREDGLGTRMSVLDRKSTRLNSSH